MERQKIKSMKLNKNENFILSPLKKNKMQSELYNLARKRFSFNKPNILNNESLSDLEDLEIKSKLNSSKSNSSESDGDKGKKDKNNQKNKEKNIKKNKKSLEKKIKDTNINNNNNNNNENKETKKENEIETSIFRKSLLKNIVSKNKIRYSLNGFDLDLTYITNRIIAMGFPADNYEKIYRNSKDEILRFFEERHKNHYKVYNLCSENTYPDDTFYHQGYFPFDDHESPPFNLIYDICVDIKNFLEKDPLNIIAIHCKAGKGRTGTIICSYLIYSGICENAEQALNFFSKMRTHNNKGVTIPSQIRYVKYFSEILLSNIKLPLDFPRVFLKGIIFNSTPNFGNMSHNCTPSFKVFNNYSKDLIYFKKIFENKTFYKNDKIEFFIEEYIELKGDVQIIFYTKKLIGKEKMFKFWFNTFFIPNDGILTLKKKDLDNACKDKQDLFFFNDFKIDVLFNIDVKEYEKKIRICKDVNNNS
jgi:phosphatidylinositol-3,4,5-trisphosphate 3-phosphatase/dual-specificity protein phosphatase PTEN